MTELARFTAHKSVWYEGESNMYLMGNNYPTLYSKKTQVKENWKWTIIH